MIQSADKIVLSGIFMELKDVNIFIFYMEDCKNTQY